MAQITEMVIFSDIQFKTEVSASSEDAFRAEVARMCRVSGYTGPIYSRNESIPGALHLGHSLRSGVVWSE